MRKFLHHHTYLLILLFLVLNCQSIYAQSISEQKRLEEIQNNLLDLETDVPGLTQKIELSVSGAALPELIRTLARSYKISVNIDPKIQDKISNNFSGQTVAAVFLFIAQQYHLDIQINGSILNITKYIDPSLNAPPPPKIVNASFNKANNEISLDLANDTLLQVAKKITQVSGTNVIILPAIYNKLISGYYQNISVTGALEKIAITNQLKLTRSDDGAFILEPLSPNEEIVTKSNNIVNPNYSIKNVYNGSNNSFSNIQVDDKAGQRILSINVTNAPIKEIIKNISEQAGVNYFVYSELKGSITANVRNQTYEQILQKILLGTVYSYTKSDNGIFLIGEQSFQGLKTDRLIPLKYRSVDSLQAFIPDDIKHDIAIKEFKELNSFLATGSPSQIDMFESFIKQIDKRVPMITTEVIIMDITKTKSKTIGLSAGVTDSIKTGGTLTGGGGLNFTLSSSSINNIIDKIGLNNVFNLGHVMPNFYVQLKALQTSGNADIRQTPKLSTLNGHAASLSIGNTQYYQVTTQNIVGSLTSTTVTTQQYIPVEANLSLEISPFVSGDDNVTMHLGVNITNFTTPPATPAGPPPTATSKFKSIIRVKNEDMILLGGIERTEKNETSSGWPLLSKIPVLKWIFGSHTKSETKVVSVVFIKPTIVY